MKGLVPRKYRDARRFSFAHTFGTTIELKDTDIDTGLSNFNQNIPNPITGDPAYPNGCTAFTRADIATNEDRIIYKPGFIYEKACYLENVPVGSPLRLQASFKAGIVYGLLALGETTDTQALAHRRGPYFEVHPVAGQDWFDALWSALQIGKKGISVGTPWFTEMNGASSISDVHVRPTDLWHCWEAVNVRTTNGVPWLEVKWWGGEPKWFAREAVNALCSVKGSDALTDVHAKYLPQDIYTVQLTLLQTLLSYYYRLLALMK